MRYYDVVLTNPTSGQVVREYTSLVNGQTDPGALNIELDIPVAAFAVPGGDGTAFVQVWGVSLQDIAQSNNLNGSECKIYGGMAKGLPLATQQVPQAGLLIDGYVWQAYGNWKGTEMTLTLQIRAGQQQQTAPRNLAFFMAKGTSFATGIQTTLAQAFPDLKPDIAISPDLVASEDVGGYYETVVGFAQWLKQYSQTSLGGSYPGVDVQLTSTTFRVFDSTSPKAPKQINFNDLIGQATWIGPLEIQFNAMMRADLAVNDYVKMPPGQVTISANSLSNFRNGSIFQGTFRISQIRHVGNFRQPNADSWITTINAFAVTDGQ